MNKCQRVVKPVIFGAGAALLLLLGGCATEKQRTTTALYPSPPSIDPLPQQQLLAMPAEPDLTPTSLKLVLPKVNPVIGPENSVMRRGASLEENASVVISVPSWLSGKGGERSEKSPSYSQSEFSTADNFHILEQFVEKGLLMSGFHVKDRSKFEAKLRDLRDADHPDRYWWSKSVDGDVGQIKAQLDKLYADGEIGMDEYSEKLLQAREQLADKRHGKSRDKDEVSDISELIRAAQDGEVQADYILQVNDLEIKYTPSTRKINIKDFDETSTFLANNPGLRVDDENGVNTLPSTISQRWMAAIFNAKLINVKTGSIDWIGEYAIDSRAVLDEGIQIRIDVRKKVVNAKTIEHQVAAYNDRVRGAYNKAEKAYSRFSSVSRKAASPISYYGLPDGAEDARGDMQTEYNDAKQSYDRSIQAYEQLVKEADKAVSEEWVIDYLVDDPHLTPDFTARAGAGSPEQLMEHFRKLGSKITTDLISSIQ